jgi:LysM repeat protein
MKTAELMALNHISDPRKLRVGQEIKVASNSSAPVPSVSPAAPAAAVQPDSSTPPSVAALEAMTADKAEQEAPVIEVQPAATVK